jgi:phage terminase small subunit
MGVRGRKSAASLSVAVTNIPGQRPEPPEKLSEVQKSEWRAVVARMPADWFTRENQALLVEHCRHVERSDVLEAAIQEAVADGRLRDVADLINLAKQLTSTLATLATKMRLSQQTRADRDKAATAVKNIGAGRRPWEIGAA